jgi:hypothetical protein
MVPKVWTFEYFVELYLYCRKDAKKKLHNCQNFMIFWNRKEKKNSRDARLICWFLHSLIEINRWILNIRRASRKGLNDWVIEDRLAKFKTRTWIFIASPFLISTESAWYPRPCSLNTHSAWNACIYPILHAPCVSIQHSNASCSSEYGFLRTFLFRTSCILSFPPHQALNGVTSFPLQTPVSIHTFDFLFLETLTCRFLCPAFSCSM